MTSTIGTPAKAAYPDHLDRDEIRVIDALILDAIAAGYPVSVCDGEEWSVKRSYDYEEITGGVGHTDETTIRVSDEANDRRADFILIHGNLASEVIADMTDTAFARQIAARAETVARALEAEGK